MKTKSQLEYWLLSFWTLYTILKWKKKNGTTIHHVAEERNLGIILDTSRNLDSPRLIHQQVLFAPPSKHTPQLTTSHISSIPLTEFSASSFASHSVLSTEQPKSSSNIDIPLLLKRASGVHSFKVRSKFFPGTHRSYMNSPHLQLSVLISFHSPLLSRLQPLWSFATSCKHQARCHHRDSAWNMCPPGLTHGLLPSLYSIFHLHFQLPPSKLSCHIVFFSNL